MGENEGKRQRRTKKGNVDLKRGYVNTLCLSLYCRCMKSINHYVTSCLAAQQYLLDRSCMSRLVDVYCPLMVVSV